MNDVSLKRAQAMTPAERYTEILTAEGFRPMPEDGSVAFKFEGRNFVLEAHEEDPAYVRLLLVYGVDANAGALLAAANDSNARRKAVKTTLHDDAKSVYFTIESFYDSGDQLQPFLMRILNALRETSDEFFVAISAEDDD